MGCRVGVGCWLLQKERITVRLHEVKAGQRARVARIEGTERFVARVTSVGLTPGCPVGVLVNRGRRPLLVSVRDSAVALDRGDCASIVVEVADEL